jgi:hypothetical protein
MSTYAEIKAQIAELENKAKEVRSSEVHRKEPRLLKS